MLPYPLDLVKRLARPSQTRILLVVLDGVGDIPVDGVTPLEAARTPHLDKLAADSSLGLSTAVAPGVTPGSGPGHLSLFGYDPFVYEVGRGVLSALGIGLDLDDRHVAARGNFATLDGEGRVSDRRAGRIATALNETLVDALHDAVDEIDGVKVSVYTEAEYRFVLVLEGEKLSGAVTETDPGIVGEIPPPVEAPDGEIHAKRTADVLNTFVGRAREVLRDVPEARAADPAVNTVLLRGIGRKPRLPDLGRVAGLRPGSVAAYPMYRGVSRLVGMECLPMDLSGVGERTENKMAAYAAHAADRDFVYFHVKKTDSYAEDGDFAGKTKQIELFDETVPGLLEQEPDVVVVTGDHSTSVALRAHSWHPLPILIWSRFGRPDGRRFTETDCRGGSLGSMRHLDILPLSLAYAGKMKKFGA